MSFLISRYSTFHSYLFSIPRYSTFHSYLFSIPRYSITHSSLLLIPQYSTFHSRLFFPIPRYSTFHSSYLFSTPPLFYLPLLSNFCLASSTCSLASLTLFSPLKASVKFFCSSSNTIWIIIWLISMANYHIFGTYYCNIWQTNRHRFLYLSINSYFVV